MIACAQTEFENMDFVITADVVSIDGARKRIGANHHAIGDALDIACDKAFFGGFEFKRLENNLFGDRLIDITVFGQGKICINTHCAALSLK